MMLLLFMSGAGPLVVVAMGSLPACFMCSKQISSDQQIWKIEVVNHDDKSVCVHLYQ